MDWDMHADTQCMHLCNVQIQQMFSCIQTNNGLAQAVVKTTSDCIIFGVGEPTETTEQTGAATECEDKVSRW